MNKVRGKYRVLNPNRLAIDIIIARIKAMENELSMLREVIADMVWEHREYDTYMSIIEEFDKITNMLNHLYQMLIDRGLEIEPPGWE